MHTRIEFPRYALVVNYLQEVSLGRTGEGLNRHQLDAARNAGLKIGGNTYHVFQLVDGFCIDIDP